MTKADELLISRVYTETDSLHGLESTKADGEGRGTA